jgi:exodeoxyribonuclease VII large subunit
MAETHDSPFPLLEATAPQSNAPELSVSDLAGALKRTIEDAYGFVRVRGELGRVVFAKSGHLYFDLKDDKACLNTVMWKASAGRLPFKPEEGLEVVAEGRLSTYPGRSNYQLIAERLRPAGVGALMQLLEERKKKLAAEGLFDAARKRPIPFLPAVIGVVTSPTGAVIRDILHRVRERFPVRVLIWPSLVQGEKAADQVAAGIAGFNALQAGGPIPRPDVIIVARGGGSIEDLWPFNDEKVVRAAAESAIPLISAVGHETDTTLIDFAADRRAPTPTGAAEMAVPVRAELMAGVETLGARLGRALARGLERRRLELRSAAGRLPRLDRVVQQPRQRLDLAARRFSGSLEKLLARKRSRFGEAAVRMRPAALAREVGLKRADARRLAQGLDAALARTVGARRRQMETLGQRIQPAALTRRISQRETELRRLAVRLRPAIQRELQVVARRLSAQARVLETLSYENVLRRGFALVERPGGGLVRSATAVEAGDALRIKFADGAVDAAAGDRDHAPRRSRAKPAVESPAPTEPPPKPRIRTRRRPEDEQGDLF